MDEQHLRNDHQRKSAEELHKRQNCRRCRSSHLHRQRSRIQQMRDGRLRDSEDGEELKIKPKTFTVLNDNFSFDRSVDRKEKFNK